MYTFVQFIHSWWAYLTLFIVLIATLNALAGFFGNKEYQPKDFRIFLFALIVTQGRAAEIKQSAPTVFIICGRAVRVAGGNRESV